MSGPHTRALSPDPGIAIACAMPKPGKLGPRQGGVEASPENVFRLSQSRWGAGIAHVATAAAGEEAQVPPHQRGPRAPALSVLLDSFLLRRQEDTSGSEQETLLNRIL